MAYTGIGSAWRTLLPSLEMDGARRYTNTSSGIPYMSRLEWYRAHVYMRVYKHVNAHVYTHVGIRVYAQVGRTCLHISLHTCLYTCPHTHVCTHVRIHVYAYVHEHMSTHVCTHVYSHAWAQIIDPHNGKKRMWDTLVLLLVVYSSVSTPLQVIQLWPV